MKLLLLGGNFPKKDEMIINNNSKITVQNAANIFQWNLICGFKNLLNNDFYVLSAPFINSYPKGYKKMIYKGCKIDNNEEYVSFFNLFGARNFSRYRNLKKALRKFLNIEDKNKYVIVYSPHVPLLEAAKYLKKIDKSIKIILLLPDLPQFVTLSENKSLLYKMLKPLDIKKFYSYSTQFDKYIFLTKNMNENVNKLGKPYMVVEGIVNNTNLKKSSEYLIYKDNKVISYTGTLDEKYGIKTLVEAFMKIKDENCRLIICGQGDCDNYIKNCKNVDSRIVFEGQVNASNAKIIQTCSNVLVNPRQNTEEFTKYSFPSKNLEYLSTGRPVVAYKLDGIPDEYNSVFFYPKDNSVDELKNTIVNCLNLSDKELINYRKTVFSFLEKKNVKSTTGRILKFILDDGGDISDKEN